MGGGKCRTQGFAAGFGAGTASLRSWSESCDEVLPLVKGISPGQGAPDSE